MSTMNNVGRGAFIAVKLIRSGLLGEKREQKVANHITNIAKAVCEEVGVECNGVELSKLPRDTKLGTKSEKLYAKFLEFLRQLEESSKKRSAKNEKREREKIAKSLRNSVRIVIVKK